MKINNLSVLFISVICLVCSCSTSKYKAAKVDYEPPVDIRSRPIDLQHKRVYSFNEGEISIDNQFDGARLNFCDQINDSTFSITISAENEPVNLSPWYAFRITSKKRENIVLNINYTRARHRYQPKISTDAKEWFIIPDNDLIFNVDTTGVSFCLSISSDTTWVSGQELETSKHVTEWCKTISLNSFVTYYEFALSGLGRPMIMLDIGSEPFLNKPIIVVLSRQHPPEVTGYYAMKAFVGNIVASDEYFEEFIDKYRILVFPIVNPDGVDLGHWRHNSGGVDLNRDWGIYNQPEVRLVADKIVKESKTSKSDVVLGIDFHSTWQDIYYTNIVDTLPLILGDFKDKWLKKIEDNIQGYKVNESPSQVKPSLTSKNWFYNQFGAVGIIYEIGDRTPREFIYHKAEVAAEAMMKILLDK